MVCVLKAVGNWIRLDECLQKMLCHTIYLTLNTRFSLKITLRLAYSQALPELIIISVVSAFELFYIVLKSKCMNFLHRNAFDWRIYINVQARCVSVLKLANLTCFLCCWCIRWLQVRLDCCIIVICRMLFLPANK